MEASASVKDVMNVQTKKTLFPSNTSCRSCSDQDFPDSVLIPSLIQEKCGLKKRMLFNTHVAESTPGRASLHLSQHRTSS